MNRVVIIGTFNFIGYTLAAHLLEMGLEVIGFSFNDQEKQQDIEQKALFLGRNTNFKFYMDEENSLEKNLANYDFDTIFFCLNDPTTFQYDQDTETHLHFSKDIFDKTMTCCHEKDCHFIYISSLDIFEDKQQIVDESAIPCPNSKHAIIHHEEEQLLVKTATKHKIPFTIIRIPTVYGPWQPQHMIYQQLIMNKIDINNSKLNIVENTADILFIDDVVIAIRKAGLKRLDNEIIHLASGKSKEWFNGINNLLEENNSLIISDKEPILYKNKKAKTLLDFQASTEIKEGIIKQQEHTALLKKFSP